LNNNLLGSRFMKIVTWNVNSIRARLENVTDWLKENQPDVVLLQEIKCEESSFPKSPIEDLGYNIAIAGQKTYNGVAILAKSPIEDVTCGLPTYSEDENCRYIEAVVGTTRVASVYVPNGMAVGSEKYHYKLTFLENLRRHLEAILLYEEAIVIGGDYNIAPHKEDVSQSELWEGEILCSPKERQQFQSLLHLGYYDALRLHHTGPGPYTWWDYRSGAWENNNGLRIDHFLLSPLAADRSQASGVDRDPRGKEKASDHAPVWCILE
jgi:exodeoxyribonuclease-3